LDSSRVRNWTPYASALPTICFLLPPIPSSTSVLSVIVAGFSDTLLHLVIARYIATSASKGLLQGDRGSQVSVRIRNLSRTRLGVKAMKKATKTMPSGLRANEIEILSRVKKRAYRLDVCLFNRCGIRFGWGAAVGIIPV
jgi:hypothetical protein